MTAILDVQNIHKHFGSLEVLRGMSLKANAGDVISLIGSSGSGKSTFLRCINLLEMPDQGSVSVCGESVQLNTNRKGVRVAADPKQVQALRTRVGMVFQQFNLWSHLSILENVMEAPVRVQGVSKAEARDIGMNYLEKVGIASKADEYPGSYPAVSSSASQLPAHSPCARRRFYLMSQPLH